MAAISFIKNDTTSSKGKHIDVSYHYVRDMVAKEEIKVSYIFSEKMLADPVTKGLSLEKDQWSCRNDGIEIYLGIHINHMLSCHNSKGSQGRLGKSGNNMI